MPERLNKDGEKDKNDWEIGKEIERDVIRCRG